MKIVEFNRNMQENKSRGLARMNDGNFLFAIKYFKDAINGTEKEDAELPVLIGRCYFEIGAYDTSLEWLYKSLKFKENYLSAFQYIFKCYMNLNQIDLAFVYVAKTAKYFENTVMPQDLEQAYVTLQEKFMKKGFVRVNGFSEVNENLLMQVRANLAQSKFDDAENVISQISSKSKEYLEAQNILSTIKLMNNNFEEAGEIASQILQKDEKNIFALCNKALSYYSKNDKIASVSTIKIALSQTNISSKERFYIATTLCQLNLHKAIVPYLEDILQNTSKFHYDFMLLLSIAYFNTEEYDKAINEINSALDIYEDDVLYLHYKNIYLKKEHKILPYTNFMFADDIMLYNEEIKNLFSKSDEEIINELKKHKNLELIIWSLKFSQNETNALIIFNLIRLEQIDLLTEFCLSTRVNNIIKMTVVKELLLQNKLIHLPMVFEGIFTVINLNELKKKIEKSNNFEQSFIQTISISAR